MKKTGLLCLVALFLMGCVSGCGKSTQGSGALPQTIHITAELPSEYPSQAKVYRVDWKTWTAEEAAELFFPGEEYEREETAMGPQLLLHRGQETAYLNAFSGIHSLQYSISSEQDNFFRSIDESLHCLDFEFESANSINQDYGAADMAAYGAEDLSFGTLEDAKSAVEDKLTALGLQTVKLRTAEARDQTTMNKNREVFNAAAAEIAEMGNDISGVTVLAQRQVTQDDEHYYLSYRQTVDGIPFSDRFWPTSEMAEANTYPSIQAYVDRAGLVSLELESPIQVGEAEKTVDIMSPEDALDVYLSEYRGAIHFDTTEVVDVELAYVVELDSEKMIARPAWLISLITDTEVDHPIRVDRKLVYTTLAVSADTGTILESNTDMR